VVNYQNQTKKYNMRKKEYFDVSRIISIYFKSETPSTNFYWVESEPIKKFFGLINTGRFTEAGWCDNRDWKDGVIYTEDEIRGYGYKVYSTDERINDRICCKAYVKVNLTHDNLIERFFESDDDAEGWIRSLKEKSAKTFEVVTYK
jgi:hypothetical protein